MLSDKTKFTVVTGFDLVLAMDAEKLNAVPRNDRGFDSEALCALQRKQSARGIVGAEIIISSTSFSVRYDSGLQDFALLASGRAGDFEPNTLAGAIEWAKKWVAKDPTRRYVWYRN